MYKNLQTLQVISEYLKATNVSTDITNDIDAEIERMIDTLNAQKSILVEILQLHCVVSILLQM